MVKLTSGIETVGVTTGDPKGRTSKVDSLMAGDSVCGTFANVLRDIKSIRGTTLIRNSPFEGDQLRHNMRRDGCLVSS